MAHWFGISTRLFAWSAGPRWQVLRHRRIWPGLHRPRANNHGHAVLPSLREIYPTRRITPRSTSTGTATTRRHALGWLTTRQSKPILVDGSQGPAVPVSPGSADRYHFRSYTTYVHDKSGSMNAQTQLLR